MSELYERIDKLLQTYTLDDILEYNDMELEDLLYVLYTEQLIKFPVEPV